MFSHHSLTKIYLLSTRVGSGWAIISPPTYYFIPWKSVLWSPSGECDSRSKSDFESKTQKRPVRAGLFSGSGELLSPTYLCLFYDENIISKRDSKSKFFVPRNTKIVWGIKILLIILVGSLLQSLRGTKQSRKLKGFYNLKKLSNSISTIWIEYNFISEFVANMTAILFYTSFFKLIFYILYSSFSHIFESISVNIFTNFCPIIAIKYPMLYT